MWLKYESACTCDLIAKWSMVLCKRRVFISLPILYIHFTSSPAPHLSWLMAGTIYPIWKKNKQSLCPHCRKASLAGAPKPWTGRNWLIYSMSNLMRSPLHHQVVDLILFKITFSSPKHKLMTQYFTESVNAKSFNRREEVKSCSSEEHQCVVLFIWCNNHIN